jgi:hypothetical protein
MWYKGNRSLDLFGDYNSRIGYATSPDGITWTKYEENPVFDIGEAGTWDDDNIYHCSILANEDGYQMWYIAFGHASGGKTGYATSTDGITWDRYEENPIFTVNVATVLLHEDVYRMWHGGGWESMIYYAEDFSHIAHADSLDLSHIYMRPTLDTLLIAARIINPDNHPLVVEGHIFSEDSLVHDSTDLTNHGDLWQGKWPVSEDEKIYRIGITTIDQETGSIHEGFDWEIEEIATTIGPIEIEYLEIVSNDTVPNPGDRIDFDIELINNGSLTTATDITAIMTSLDASCAVVRSLDRSFGDIEPGTAVIGNRPYRIEFLESCTDIFSVSFRVDISTGNFTFWSDTFSVDIVSAIGRAENQLPISYSLKQNYPNPFNPVTMINYQLPMINDVELSIYNLLGQKVATLVDERQQAGYHQVEWDASNFSSGIYYYRIEAGEFQDVKKMILIR